MVHLGTPRQVYTRGGDSNVCRNTRIVCISLQVGLKELLFCPYVLCDSGISTMIMPPVGNLGMACLVVCCRRALAHLALASLVFLARPHERLEKQQRSQKGRRDGGTGRRVTDRYRSFSLKTGKKIALVAAFVA